MEIDPVIPRCFNLQIGENTLAHVPKTETVSGPVFPVGVSTLVLRDPNIISVRGLVRPFM